LSKKLKIPGGLIVGGIGACCSCYNKELYWERRLLETTGGCV